jgi:zinc transport system permease protein
VEILILLNIKNKTHNGLKSPNLSLNMSIATELQRVVELFQFPFMQRALLAGMVMGMMGGLLGSFTILRQLSFFSDALGHSALLGISLGFLLGLDPSIVLLPFAVIFALGITYLLNQSKLGSDALLNMVYSSSLAASIVILKFVGQYKGGLGNLLFGDILAVQWGDLWVSGGLLILCIGFIGVTLRIQILMTLNESLAMARGVQVGWHRIIFTVLLALVVGVSIKAIGVLLVSAFIVIPACIARLWSQQFHTYVLLSAGLGVVSAVLGIVLSALFELPSGPSIVITQMGFFLLTLGGRSWILKAF